MGNLTARGIYVSLFPLQPKSGFLPEAGRGRPKFRKLFRTGRTKPGNRFQGHFQGQARQLISQAFGRAILESVFKFTLIEMCGAVAFMRDGGVCLKIMLDIVYIGTAILFFAAFALYARGCEKL
jgi:hypothetical protein